MAEEIAICSNPWCKVQFKYDTEKEKPKVCKKCRSFDTELSGGVTWTDKKYDGPRYDNNPHQMSMNIKRYGS
jgi:hypothetical protein